MPQNLESDSLPIEPPGYPIYVVNYLRWYEWASQKLLHCIFDGCTLCASTPHNTHLRRGKILKRAWIEQRQLVLRDEIIDLSHFVLWKIGLKDQKKSPCQKRMLLPLENSSTVQTNVRVRQAPRPGETFYNLTKMFFTLLQKFPLHTRENETHNASRRSDPRSRRLRRTSRSGEYTCGLESCTGTLICGRCLPSPRSSLRRSCRHSRRPRHTPTSLGCILSWCSWTQTACRGNLHRKRGATFVKSSWDRKWERQGKE